MNRISLFLWLFPGFLLGQSSFQWPTHAKMALSLSFDDARESQVLYGTPLLDSFGVKATFYVVPSAVKRQVERWKGAVAKGHEIGNHTVSHPCTGNFGWSRSNALESYDLDRMRAELLDCNRAIKELLQVECKVFAYPCGQKFIGKGLETKSYVPLVAAHFTSGRGWMDEAPNDPLHCNRDQLTCLESDGKTFAYLRNIMEEAKKTGAWVILGGHEINESGAQTTQIDVLRKLLEYAKDPMNGIWIAPVGEVMRHIDSFRNAGK